MSLERLVPSSPSCTEIEEVLFPEEIWIFIWSYLDFKTLQKTCTCVSKSWMEMIRRSKLSWEMKLGIANMLEVKDFNAILSHWTDIREIHFSSEQDFAKFRLSLSCKKSLKKIVIPSQRVGTMLGWALVTKYWIDPKHLLTPSDEIKNVIELFIDVVGIPKELVEFDMREDDCDLTNVEFLEIKENNDEGLSSKNVVPFLLRFKELKKLVIQHLEIYIDYLPDIIRYLGNTKAQRISVSLWVINDSFWGSINELDEEATKEIFNEALEIFNEKFPFPDGRILELEIFEYNGNRQPSHSIKYGECGAMLTIDDVMYESDTSDSESDTSDSESDSSDSENDTTDSESDTSDSMDESDGNSEFMNHESVENSDTENMNVQE